MKLRQYDLDLAEQMAYAEEQRRREQAIRDRLAAPGEGYGSVGPLMPGELQICLRCSAVVFGRDRHDAWHDSL